MSHTYKTYVAFANEDLHYYRLMETWRDNDNIDFNFYDAHDLYMSRDATFPEAIKSNLRERLENAQQIVLLGSSNGKKEAGDRTSLLAQVVAVTMEFNLPVVVANLDGGRTVNKNFIPRQFLADYYTMSVSFQPAIVQYSLDHYAESHARSRNRGPYCYKNSVYKSLGL